MKFRITILLALLLTLLTTLPAQSEPRILVVGDSWAAGIVAFRAFEQVLESEGIDGVEIVGLKTAIGGSRADQWASNHQGKWETLDSELEATPTVDIVHLSIGGNDFLNACREMDIGEATPEARAERWESICEDIETLVERLQEKRPGIHILLCGYDFLDPNRIAKVYGIKGKGDLTLQEMNDALVEFEKARLDLTKRLDGVEYVQNLGVLQHAFGVEGAIEPQSVPFPGKAPDYDPFPGGDPDYGSGDAMPDGVHPTPEGYVHLIRNGYEQFYADWLKEE